MGTYLRFLGLQVTLLKVLWAYGFRFMLFSAKILGLDIRPVMTGSLQPPDSFKKIIEPYRITKEEMANINIEVPEELIKRAAEHVGGDDNQYHMLLKVGDKYREANLHPVILTDNDHDVWRVTAREFLDNPNMVN